MFFTAIGVAAAVLTTFSFIPQIIKVYRNKSAKDLSLITIIQLSCGVSLWIAYGIYIKDAIVISANSVTLATLIVLLGLYFNYRRRGR